MKDAADFEITFLGTGTSHGIPVIACDCRVCRSTDPRDKRLRTAIHVRTPECSFVVDTPPDFRAQCLRENITRLDAVLYTHSHTDHIMGFDDIRRFCETQDLAMPMHASPEVLDDLRRVFQFAFDGSAAFRNYIRPHPIPITGPFRLGETDITPVDLPHGRYHVHGYVFSRRGRKLAAYMTDCHAVPPAAADAARDVEVLIIDALRFKAHSTHLTVEQALQVARELRARRAYFTHMCHELGHADTEAGLPADVRLAYDGLKIRFE
jgi:phosphoribosyl 1,2-cyclic phosphate phosphodiesterase